MAVSQAQMAAMASAAPGAPPMAAAPEPAPKPPERKKKKGSRSERLYKAKGIASQKRAAQAAVAAERERCAGIALSFRGANHTDETCQAIADKIRG